MKLHYVVRKPRLLKPFKSMYCKFMVVILYQIIMSSYKFLFEK